ncbi:MAG: hypothetical protein K8I29_16060 [Alphaproteobacteria bacterium]|uniref:Uncharacterized protein n=1 Tax=Candidatus Nitrobium versatile TaxID=2884831 RepID=A0A953M2E9_9BACT|nr:hypothetical protein [Candidatus Nitrobium versatile]
MKRIGLLVAAVSLLSLATTSEAFFDSLVKSAAGKVAEEAVKGMSKKMDEAAKPQADGTAPAAQAVSTQPAKALFDAAECRKGQLVNPYFLMLHNNFLDTATADMGDQKCISAATLRQYTERYITGK